MYTQSTSQLALAPTQRARGEKGRFFLFFDIVSLFKAKALMFTVQALMYSCFNSVQFMFLPLVNLLEQTAKASPH